MFILMLVRVISGLMNDDSMAMKSHDGFLLCYTHYLYRRDLISGNHLRHIL